MRALPLTASQSVPAREVFGTGTIGSAREMSLRRRSNRGRQRRASEAKRSPLHAGLDGVFGRQGSEDCCDEGRHGDGGWLNDLGAGEETAVPCR